MSQEDLEPLMLAGTSAQEETFSEAALKRIKDRRDREIREGNSNYNAIDALIDRIFVAVYKDREDRDILNSWKRELLERLQLPLPYDHKWNFSAYSSEITGYLTHEGYRLKDHNWPAKRFDRKGSFSAVEVYKEISKKFILPERAHYNSIARILNPYATREIILDHYDKSNHKQVKKIVEDLADYLYKSNWYLKQPDNWARIREAFDQLKQGRIKLVNHRGNIYNIAQPEEFVKSLHLVPDPNASFFNRRWTGAPGSDHFKSLQHHHRVTRRYALISGVRTYGSAEWGGQSLVPL